MKTVSVLIIDEARVLRDMLADVINAQPDLHVVGQLREARDALVRVRDLDPDVLILGTLSDDAERLDVIQALRTAASHTKIVVMDFRPAKGAVAELVKAGAHGFILPDTPVENMLHVVRLAASSPVELPATVALGNGFESREAWPVDEMLAGSPAHLTKRELEIARLISEGRSNKDIARQLRLSSHTVKSHVRRIMEKMALHSRLQIAAYAYRGHAAAPAEFIQRD